MSHWLSKVACCPRCGGALSFPELEEARTALVRCASCGPYPCLAGVPVLYADPFAYCRAYRDSILATLAEHDAADAESVAVVDAFSRGRGSSDVFSDDWTESEESGEAPPRQVGGPSFATLTKLREEAVRTGPAAWLANRLKRREGTVVEVGCGAGERSEALASRAERLVIADRSLRAVLRARRRAGLVDEAAVAGVVFDAEALPLKAKSVDVLVAEHLVDLLDEPKAFFEGARRAVKRGGRLLLTTSEPSLGTDDDEALNALVREAKWRIGARADGLPWLRVNSSRFIEVYLVRALELR